MKPLAVLRNKRTDIRQNASGLARRGSVEDKLFELRMKLRSGKSKRRSLIDVRGAR
jgi:hypothetical protein